MTLPFHKTLVFIKKKHRGQFHAGNKPVWLHLFRVALMLDTVLRNTKEARAKERQRIVCAALGHDLLEDTTATEKEIRAVFGHHGYEYIFTLTNEWGDTEKRRYVAKVVKADEAVRLIKLSDLYDNISSVAHSISLLGVPWVTGFFLPIVTPMRKALAKTTFTKYRNSAEYLLSAISIEIALLENEVEVLKKNAAKTL